MKTITAQSLKTKLDQGEDLKLVMTMPASAFEKSHIPGSLQVYSIEDALRQLKPEDSIVVYCTDSSCMASVRAYYQLSSAGYPHLVRFAGGLTEWIKQGYPLEGNMEHANHN